MRFGSQPLKIVLIGAVMAGAGATAAFAGAELNIPEPEFNFGHVVQHNHVSCVFWLKSVGDDTLRITNVVPGCGCTEAPIDDTLLAPGDSTALRIKFNSRQFRGRTSKKPFVMVEGDPNKHFVQIVSVVHSSDEQLSPLNFEPYRIDVSQFTERPRRRARFVIKNQSDRDYKLTLIEAAETNFDVDLPSEVKAGNEAVGSVTVHEDLVDEPFEQSITIEIDDEEGTRFTLPVRRDVSKRSRAGSWKPPGN